MLDHQSQTSKGRSSARWSPIRLMIKSWGCIRQDLDIRCRCYCVVQHQPAVNKTLINNINSSLISIYLAERIKKRGIFHPSRGTNNGMCKTTHDDPKGVKYINNICPIKTNRAFLENHHLQIQNTRYKTRRYRSSTRWGKFCTRYAPVKHPVYTPSLSAGVGAVRPVNAPGFPGAVTPHFGQPAIRDDRPHHDWQ